MTNVQERSAASIAALASSALHTDLNAATLGTSRAAMARSGDAIRRIGPQSWLPPGNVAPPSGGIPGGMSGIISQLMNIIQQLLSMLGLGGTSGAFGGSQGPEQYFQSGSGSSTGDPHLSFSGTDGSGSNQQSRFDSMAGHGDLLDSDSFAGGYQISTAVTQPGANGVTYNQQAIVSTDFGGTQVSLDRNGNATILQNGQTISLASGQRVDLGNGETVTRNSNGSVVVLDENGLGGILTTTLTENGQGVDVNTQANNVDLGGDLVHQPPQPRPSPAPLPVPAPMRIAY